MLALAGCGSAAADVAAGPGPTNYTVQPQPAPGSCHYRAAADGQNLPDPNCTPGAVNPKVTPDTLEATICRTGYTKSIRPPKEITEAEKKANAAAYSYTGQLSGAGYHLVPLEVGGDPNDPRNLWVEKRQTFMGADDKDQLESYLHDAVYSGREPLSQAQEDIATDWVAAYCKARLPKCSDGVH